MYEGIDQLGSALLIDNHCLQDILYLLLECLDCTKRKPTSLHLIELLFLRF